MKTYSRFRQILLAAALVLAAGVPARAQTSFPISLPVGTESVSQAMTASADTGAFVKYIGSAACASVAVAAGGDLTFTEGPCGAEVATATFECPVSGALGGVITVANAACDTVIEVANVVNTSASNWRFIPYTMVGADSTNDTFVTIAASQATGPGGLALKVDNAVALFASVPLTPTSTNYTNMSLGPQATSFKAKPFAGTRAILTGAAVITAHTTSFSKVIAVDRTLGTSYSDVVTTIWPNTANGATGVAIVFGTCDTGTTGCNPAWGQGGLICPPDQLCMLRVTNTGSMTANTENVTGLYLNSGAPLRGVQ